MAKLGKKGYKGPVHEAVRKSPLGGLVQSKKKRKYDAKLRRSQEKWSQPRTSSQRRETRVQQNTYGLMQSHGYSYGEAARTAEEKVRRNEMAANYRVRAAEMKSSSGKVKPKKKSLPKAPKSKGYTASDLISSASSKASSYVTGNTSKPKRQSAPKRKSAPKKTKPAKATKTTKKAKSPGVVTVAASQRMMR